MEEEKRMYCREICAICFKVSPVDFEVPNKMWRLGAPPHMANDIICLSCFIRRADEKLLDWDKDIKFYPTSKAKHIRLMFHIMEENIEERRCGKVPDVLEEVYNNSIDERIKEIDND